MSLPTQTELQALLSYNPLTGELYWKSRPYSMFASERIARSWNTKYACERAFTAIDRKGYKVGAIHGINYRASRVIFKLVYGIDADQVDHEDGDRQNNRLTNLRDVTGLDNQKNMKRSLNNKSGVTGVHWNKEKKGWDAYITSNRRRVHLGRFINMADAVQCRKDAEKQHGFHANHGR